MSTATALWMNMPLMVLAFGLMVGIPLWMVLRRSEWHGKQEARSLPAYLAHRQEISVENFGVCLDSVSRA